MVALHLYDNQSDDGFPHNQLVRTLDFHKMKWYISMSGGEFTRLLFERHLFVIEEGKVTQSEKKVIPP